MFGVGRSMKVITLSISNMQVVVRLTMLLHGVMCGKNIVESLLCGGCVRDSSLME